MKNIKYFLFVFALTLFACKDNNKSAEISQESELRADWLLGDWERINEQEGIRTFERWIKTNNGYEGVGWTMKDQDTIFKETLKLVEKDNQWDLVVSDVNQVPTHFTITGISKDGFVSENEENEFPKKIEYRREGYQLFAIISNSEKEIEFIFVPKK